MKKIFLLLLILTGFSRFSLAQVTFTFDSIWAPPYICQASAFDVEVFGTRSGGNIQNGSQSFLVRNDTIYVRFHFINGTGPATPSQLYRIQNIPAPFTFGLYKLVVQGYYNGQLQQTINSRISICSSISGTGQPEAEKLQFKIYPNPVQASLEVVLPAEKFIGTITLTDLRGKTLFNKKTRPNQRTITLNMNQFPAGIYLIHYHSAETSLTQKFLKQ